MGIDVPDCIQTGSDHFLEDIQPQVRYRETKGVEFARTRFAENKNESHFK